MSDAQLIYSVVVVSIVMAVGWWLLLREKTDIKDDLYRQINDIREQEREERDLYYRAEKHIAKMREARRAEWYNRTGASAFFATYGNRRVYSSTGMIDEYGDTLGEFEMQMIMDRLGGRR